MRRSTSRPGGTTGDAFLQAFDEVIVPVAQSFEPTWVLVSAGFDAHRADPLARLALLAAKDVRRRLEWDG